MKRVISGSLVLILVAITIGVPVFRHTCHVFDRSEISIINQDACCAPGNTDPNDTIDVKCCSLEQFNTAMDYESLVQESNDFEGIYISVQNSTLYELSLFVEESIAIPLERPPPLANRDLLNTIQVYLI